MAAKPKKPTAAALAEGAPALIAATSGECVQLASAWAKANPTPNREGWLSALVESMRPLFVAAGHPLPEAVLVSFGFPSKGGMSRKKRTIGQCWSHTVCEDKVTPHVFLHPELPAHDKSPASPAADEVLAHELVHAAVGVECKHRGAFKRCALAIGLEGKMTSTRPSAELHAFLGELTAALGECPHKRLSPGSTGPKGKGRMLKMECCCSGGRPIRVSRQQGERGGYLCELCGESWVMEGESRPGAGDERAILRAKVEEENEGIDEEEIGELVEEVLEERDRSQRVTRAVEAMARLSLEELTDALEALQARPAMAAGRAS